VRVASAERSVGSDQLLRTADDATPRTRARYGFSPRYEQLKGRLEHSETSGVWKLRYIPIDGATDDFGGSVLIDNPRSLGDLDAGDFVEVRGAIDSTGADELSYAPKFRIADVRALAD